MTISFFRSKRRLCRLAPLAIPGDRKCVKSLAAFAFASLAAVSHAEEKPVPHPGYRLVWADEFETAGRPNPKNWRYEKGFQRNNELQCYRPENAFCKDGLLVIEGRRQTAPNPHFVRDSPDWRKARANIEYTSACLTTQGLHSWQYGRFEIRARIKAQAGLWPAIWFLGEEGRWPANGEIDLMEFYNGNILANACWMAKGGKKPEWDESKKPVESFGDPDWDSKFHVWLMDWDSDRIILSVDGMVLNTIELSKTVNPAGHGPANPFRQPHYLLLNLAIGGNNGGDPSKTAFPTRYEIDYVRVYQKEARN